MAIVTPPASGSIDSFTPALKQYYLSIVPENVTYKKNPLFAMLPKIVTFEGLNSPIPLSYSNPQGVSAEFAVANGVYTPTQYQAFTLTRAKKYGVAQLTGDVYLAARSSVGSFVSSFASEIDNTFLEMSQDYQVDLYGDGTGARGQIASILGNVITLVNPTDARKFSVEMSLVIAVGPGALDPVRVGNPYVVAVDVNLGTVTLNAVPPLTVAGDFLYRRGSRGVGLNLTGLAGYLPLGGPSAAPFFGVDRTVDPQKLAGNFLDARSASVWDTLQSLASICDTNGGTPDYAFMHPQKFNELTKSLGSQVRYENLEMEEYANIGFRTIIVETSFGPIRCVSDPYCTPVTSAFGSVAGAAPYVGSFPLYLLQLDTWSIMSLDALPHVIQDDGLFVVRSATEDAIQMRFRGLAQLQCRAPAYSGVAVI